MFKQSFFNRDWTLQATPRFQEMIDGIQNDLLGFEHRIQRNRIAITVSAYDAEEIILPTLVEIVEQLRSCALYGEIFVILNSGGGYTPCLGKAFSDVAYKVDLQRKLNVDRIQLEKIPIECPDDFHAPNPLKFDPPLSKFGRGVSLFLILQSDGLKNKGKIRALRDLMQGLYRANIENYYNPELLLAIDAESRIRLVQDHGRVSDKNKGLLELISHFRAGIDVVGTRFHLTQFSQGKEKLDETIPAKQWFINHIHGGRTFQLLVGGGILGRFSIMLCTLRRISQTYPGAITEDVFLTASIKKIQVTYHVHPRVAHLNRCPAEGDRTAEQEQILRWLKGVENVKQECGADTMKYINPSVIESILIYYARALSNFKMMCYSLSPWLWREFIPMIEMRRKARLLSHDSIKGCAAWTSVK